MGTQVRCVRRSCFHSSHIDRYSSRHLRQKVQTRLRPVEAWRYASSGSQPDHTYKISCPTRTLEALKLSPESNEMRRHTRSLRRVRCSLARPCDDRWARANSCNSVPENSER